MTEIASSALPSGIQYVNTDSNVGTGGNTALGQQDFLTLMTAQLQNQDPFAPMDNTEFLGQMAQFSTVAGIDQMNATLATLSGEFGMMRVSTASSYLGQQVLVPGTTTRADAEGTIEGIVDLEAAVSDVTITYTDVTTGAIIHQQQYGSQPSGEMSFGWDDVPQSYVDNNSQIRVTVATQGISGTQVVTPNLYAEVVAVELNPDGSTMTLQVEDYGALNSMEVTALR